MNLAARRTGGPNLWATHIQIDRIALTVHVECSLHERFGIVRAELCYERLILYWCHNANRALPVAHFSGCREVDSAIRSALLETLAVEHRRIAQVRVILARKHSPRKDAMVHLR